MNNTDLQEQLQLLEMTAAELRKDVSRSDGIPALDLAAALVRAAKMNADLGKLAGRVRKQLAPLFKKPDDGDQDGGKPRPTK